MGFRLNWADFPLAHFLTGSRPQPPYVTNGEVGRFFGAIEGLSYELIGRDDWKEQLRSAAKEAAKRLNSKEENLVCGSTSLKELRTLFKNVFDFTYFGFFYDGEIETKDADRYFRTLSEVSGKDGLIFQAYKESYPRVTSEGRSTALPIFFPNQTDRAFNHSLLRKGGVFFWTRNRRRHDTDSHFYCDLNRGMEFVNLAKKTQGSHQQLMYLTHGFSGDLDRPLGLGVANKIVHVSDIHIGTEWWTNNKRHLYSFLNQNCRAGDRVVITGDILNSPNAESLGEFDRILDYSRGITGKDANFVWGNHDVKVWGTIGNRTKILGNRSAPGHNIDHDLSAVFLNYFSSNDFSFARGGVLPETMASALEWRKTTAPQGYSIVASLHHHIRPFATAPSAFYEKLFHALGAKKPLNWTNDFSNMAEFAEHCLETGVNIVLHGHKHYPRYDRFDGEKGPLVIGCGSSVGADVPHPTFNLVWSSPHTSLCKAEAFRWSDDVAGFECIYMG